MWIPLLVAGMAAVVGGGAFVVTQLRDSDSGSVAAQPSVASSGGSGDVATGPSDTTPTRSAPTSTPSPTATPTPTPTELTAETALLVEPVVAVAQLGAMVAADSSVLARLAETWVPQVSSKCPGLSVDIGPDFMPDGTEETASVTAPQILAFQLALRQRYGAILTTAADLHVTTAPDSCTLDQLWVALVPQAFPSSDGTLAWCESAGFPVGECAARNVAPPGETARPLVFRPQG